MSDEVAIKLTRAEALVLFEWIARIEKANALPVVDQAEEYVFWRIEGQLEKTLVEPFAANYTELLDAARAMVRKDTAPR